MEWVFILICPTKYYLSEPIFWSPVRACDWSSLALVLKFIKKLSFMKISYISFLQLQRRAKTNLFTNCYFNICLSPWTSPLLHSFSVGCSVAGCIQYRGTNPCSVQPPGDTGWQQNRFPKMYFIYFTLVTAIEGHTLNNLFYSVYSVPVYKVFRMLNCEQ